LARLDLSDGERAIVAPLLPGAGEVRNGRLPLDDRKVPNGIFLVLCAGTPSTRHRRGAAPEWAGGARPSCLAQPIRSPDDAAAAACPRKPRHRTASQRRGSSPCGKPPQQHAHACRWVEVGSPDAGLRVCARECDETAGWSGPSGRWNN